MENTTEENPNQNTNSAAWKITGITFIILAILLIGISAYLGYKLYYCKKRPNAVVFID